MIETLPGSSQYKSCMPYRHIYPYTQQL